MTIRLLRVPGDLEDLSKMVVEAFQYPDNPEWGVQEDEGATISKEMENIRKSWWIIRIGQIIIPAMRELLNGLVWEEEGKIIGVLTVQRRGTSDTWLIGSVATHPEYRRCGIARKMVEAALELLRNKQGRIAVLDVIEGNLPAFNLYQSLGFETFSGTYELEYQPKNKLRNALVPPEYELLPSDLFQWQPRFEWNKQHAPASTQTYEPLEESRFRQPGYVRLIYPLINQILKRKSSLFLVKHSQSGEVVGYLGYDIRTGGNGKHSINLRLASEHAQIGQTLMNYAIEKVSQANPEMVIEMSIPFWQEHIADSAHQLGFTTRLKMHRMGILL